MELTRYPQVGQKCRFDPYQETGGMSEMFMNPARPAGTNPKDARRVTGKIIYVNLRHQWFLARYGAAHKRISFKFCDIGKLVTVEGMKMPEPPPKKPVLHIPNASKPVICTTTGKRYPSIKAASDDIGISESAIASCCRGYSKQVKGFAFRWAEGVKK